MEDHRPTNACRERGFALPAALLALVVIAAIITGGFYAASQQDRVSQSVQGSRDALYIAEQGIADVLGTMTLNDLPRGGTFDDTSFASDVVQSGRVVGRDSVVITQLDSLTFLVRSDGETRNHGHVSAVRRVAQVVRTAFWNVPMGAALYVNGGLTVSGNAYIQGDDQDSGACNGGSALVSGVVSSDASQVDIKKADHVVGDPPVLEDTAMTATSLLEYGNGVDFETLAAMADKRYPSGESPPMSPAPVTSGGSCDTSQKSNWGDPQAGNACSAYMPMVFVDGDAHFSNGRGQGVLLVNGNLQLTGQFEYDGVVIVKGSIQSTGTGNHVNGVVLVNNGAVDLDVDDTFMSGSSVIQYSSCSAQNAIAGHMRLQPIASRSWFDLTAAGATR